MYANPGTETFKRDPLPDSFIKKAFQYLFNQYPSAEPDYYADFVIYVRKKYQRQGCVVLFALSSDFKKFLGSRDIGRKEVIINSQNINYTWLPILPSLPVKEISLHNCEGRFLFTFLQPTY